ncbi:Pycsar system effector family protein [Kitasatospora xanthocidica]|uniref:Pycsar system effector family protein n=1 Tax=Kitasatospora xanthocidica TaxID=83382 RepID=UPI001C7022B6|nr:Pycsar system effector family protein [Kitasatospora xanthocidica]
MTATGPAPAPAPAPEPAPAPAPAPAPEPAPEPVPCSDEARFVADRLLCVVREDIGRADTKSSILLTAALGLPALLLDRNWADGRPGTLAAVLLALGGVFWAAGAVALVRAILPRTGTLRDHDGVTFFGDLLTSEGRPALTEQIVAAGRDPLDWLLVQAVDVSTILAAKYRRIRWGVACLAPGSVLATAGILLT